MNDVNSQIPEIRMVDVRKTFGQFHALSGVSCTFKAGELTLIMGPNGAGKSTMLSILSTLSRPTSGEVFYGDWRHRYFESHGRHRIGLVAHSPMLYPQMSPRENLLFFARLYRVNDPAETVESWIIRLRLHHAATKPIQQLSRGTVQRVALARALLPDPYLLLLDEPFTGLDQEAIACLTHEIQSAVHAGKIIVLITHDPSAIDGQSSHLVLLDKGRIGADIYETNISASRIQEHYRNNI